MKKDVQKSMSIEKIADNSKLVNALKDIDNEIDKYKTHFYNEFEKEWNELAKETGKKEVLDSNFSSFQPLDLISILMFGETKYNENIIKKIDYNKNKSSFKNMLLNLYGVYNSLNLITYIIRDFDDFLIKISSIIELIWSDESFDDKIITKDEVCRLYELINAYTWESNHIRSDCTTLKNLIEIINNHPDIPHLNKDTFKRYYFNDVYELKNSVKIFDTDKMYFGETNNIMNHFNKIFDFAFGDIICIYYTLNNQFKVLCNS